VYVAVFGHEKSTPVKTAGPASQQVLNDA
jgi:hypothetical protein